MRRFIQWLWGFRYVPGYKLDGMERVLLKTSGDHATQMLEREREIVTLHEDLQKQIRELQLLREDCRDQGKVIEESRKAMDQLHEEIGRLRCELVTAEEEIEDWKRKAVSLRHGKAIWDAANRLQDQCTEFVRELNSYKGTVGKAYEADQKARG